MYMYMANLINVVVVIKTTYTASALNRQEIASY